MDGIILHVSNMKIREVYPMKAPEYVAKKHPAMTPKRRSQNKTKVHHAAYRLMMHLN